METKPLSNIEQNESKSTYIIKARGIVEKLTEEHLLQHLQQTSVWRRLLI